MDTEQLTLIISKLEAHKGSTYQLSKTDLRMVMFYLKDYQRLIKKLDGDHKDE
jgi:hypothetical protein